MKCLTSDETSGPPVSDAFLKASSKGFLVKSWNNPISSQFFRNLVGVGVWSVKKYQFVKYQ